MKANLLSSIAGLMLSAFAASTAFAGNGVGNGVPDLDAKKEAAWFVDPTREISYCIKEQLSFGVSLTFASEQIKSAQEMWEEYIRSRGVNNSNIQLSTKWKKLGGCNGSEDLQFLLGGDNPDSDSKHEDFVAKTVKNDLQMKEGWSKGLIWIASNGSLETSTFPSWQKKNHLLSVILHELGHVFGCGHVEGTILAEHLSLTLKNDYQKGLGSIDQSKILYWSSDTYRIFRGVLGTDTLSKGPSGSETLFKKVMGRAPQGAVQAAFYPTLGTLFVSDAIGESRIYMTFLSPETSNYVFKVKDRRFFRMIEIEGGGYLITGDQPFGFMKTTKISTPGGDYWVNIAVNADTIGQDGPLAIDLLDGNQVLGFFRSYPVNQ